MYYNASDKRRESALALWGVTSFLIQYINTIVGSYLLYLVMLGISAFILFAADRRILFYKSTLPYELLWILNLFMIVFSMMRGSITPSERNDIITYVVGVLFIMFSGENESIFKKVLKVIRFFALYYACTIWIQVLLPSVYSLYLGFLPSDIVKKIVSIQTANSAYTGFSTNTGFTAGHICAGFLIAASKFLSGTGKRKKMLIEMCFLFVSLLMTGKRAHLLAMVVAVIAIYLVSESGKQRFERFNRLLLVIACVLVFFMLFSDALAFIPTIERTMDTIRNYIAGEDVSSGRNNLYEYALELFAENPITGIGWGGYKSTVAGNATLITALDTHNIYLQLLSETGLIGFNPIVVAFVLFLFATVRLIPKIKFHQPENLVWKNMIFFSLGYQIFFLVYGAFGNPLYDYNFVILYMLSCAVTTVSVRKLKRLVQERRLRII